MMERREQLEQWVRQQPQAVVERLLEVEQRLQELLAENAELKRQLFGSKADKLSPEQEQQLAQVNQDLCEQARRTVSAQAQILAEEKPPVRRVRHPLPTQLETIVQVLEPAPEEKVCPRCGPKQRIGEERSERINLIPAKLVREITVRPKYACHCGECGVAIAPLPPSLMAQSRLGLGLAVHIVLERFDDHVAYYSLEKIFRERHGVIIARQQMVQWVEQIALLLVGIYNAMWEELLAAGYLQIDETPVKVLDPEVQGKAGKGWLWFYALPGGDVLVVFCSSRGHEDPKERLKHFRGTIQTDGYSVYPLLERKLEIDRIGCLAHSRRKFYQAALEGMAEAIWFIAQIRRLYQIEDQARESMMTAQERLQLRQERNAQSIWLEIKHKAEELKPRLLPQSSLGKAIHYFLNEYQALIGYLREGRFEIDNNLVENAIRPSCVGKKRWLFVGHPDAGWRSAVIYSILGSCRRRGINPQEYLTDVLARLPTMKSGEEKALVPSRWKPKPQDSG